MSAPTLTPTELDMSTEDIVRRLARLALTVTVRGRREHGEPWGEAVLAEFGQTRGRWEALRWSAGGIRAALRERRARGRELPRWVRIRRRAIAVLVIGTLAGLGIQHWLLTPVYEPSVAMAPALRPADYWLMDRISFRIGGLHYDDIVAYEQKIDDHGEEFTVTRRVIGLPGDVITCENGQVSRNGATVSSPNGQPSAQCTSLTVPAGSVYLLGDNRYAALEWNPIAIDRIEGRLLTRLWNAGEGSLWSPQTATR